MTNTYDVYFDDAESSDNKGFKESFEFCKNYIEKNIGSNDSFFGSYQGGTVSIVCNETGINVLDFDI